jgi:hypothetical protein
MSNKESQRMYVRTNHLLQRPSRSRFSGLTQEVWRARRDSNPGPQAFHTNCSEGLHRSARLCPNPGYLHLFVKSKRQDALDYGPTLSWLQEAYGSFVFHCQGLTCSPSILAQSWQIFSG